MRHPLERKIEEKLEDLEQSVESIKKFFFSRERKENFLKYLLLKEKAKSRLLIQEIIKILKLRQELVSELDNDFEQQVERFFSSLSEKELEECQLELSEKVEEFFKDENFSG